MVMYVRKGVLALAPTCVWKERAVMVMYVRKGVLALAPTCFVREGRSVQ